MRTLLGVVLAAALLATPAGADASDARDDAGRDDWSFHLRPYLWVASLEGDLATISGLPTAEVDASFSEIFENTDFALMIQGEARYDRVGFLVDLAYMKLSTEERTPGPLFGGVDVESTTLFVTLGPVYRAVERDGLDVDLFAGMRIWDVDTVLKLRPGVAAAQRASGDETWVDPLLGARGRLELWGPLSASAAADLGGFGAASDLTWQVLATLDVRPWSWLALRAGYRHLAVDYEEGGFVWDVSMSGPILGAAIHF